MKRKIVSLVLALCILCMCGLFTACDGLSTFAVINSAIEKTENLDSVAAELKMDMVVTVGDTKTSVPMTADMKIKNANSDNPIVSAAIAMTMLEQNIEMEMYQEGDWAYMVLGDAKYKTNIDVAENEYDYADNMDDMLQELPEELLKDVQLTENEDGSKTMSVSVPEKMFADIYDDFIEETNSGTEVDVDDLKISDTLVKITVKDGYVTVYEMQFKMDVGVEGQTASTEIKASLTFKNPGSEVTVTPPAGYKDFEELSIG